VRTGEALSISKFETTYRELLERVWRKGKPLVVTRRGEPIAEVIPFAKAEKGASWLGAMRGSGKIVGKVASPASDTAEREALGS
jgi:prevent-host-death family protein